MRSNPPSIEKDLYTPARGPDNGRPKGVVSIEEALGERDESLQTIFDNVNAIIVRLNKYGKILEANAKAEDCFGFKREEVIGKHFTKLGIFTVKDLPRLVKLYGDAMKGKITTYLDEIEATNKNGQKIIIKLYSSIVKKDGKIDGVISIIHDMTEQKRAEEARLESEDKYRQIFNNVNAVIVRLNNYGKITEINSRVEEIYGFRREDVLGKHFTKLGILTVKDLPRLVKLFGDAVRGKRLSYHDELETRDKAGHKKYIDVNCSVIKKNGKIDSTVSIIYDVTERRKAEEAMRLSEQKYAGLVEHGNDGILIIQDHVIKYINSKLLDIFGYPYEEVIGKQFINVVAEEHRESVISRFRKRLAGEEVPEKYEFDIINKNGERVNVEVNASLMEFEGRPADMAIVRDITERKKAEEALRISEETFSKVFHASPNPICIISVEGETFIDINESYTQFTGYTREETIGRTSAELGLWGNEDDLLTMRTILMQKGKMYNHQFTSRTKLGDLRTALFSAEIINITGRPCIILVITDITEQKWAEDALKESEGFTSSLLTHTPSPIFVTYPDRSIKYVNPAFERLTGFSVTEVVGMKIPYPWWPEESRVEIDNTLKQGLSGNGMKREMAYRKKNGEPFWVELTATKIKKNGEQQYILVNWVDITERKQMEMALRESEEKFSMAFNASPNIMSITSLDGTFIEVNESFLRMTGLTREKVIGRSSHELNLWNNPHDRTSLAEKIREGGRFDNEEYQFRGKADELHTVLFSAEKINLGGKPCLISVSNDITERTRMEEALRFSDAAFKSIHESIIALDNDRNITYWNNISEQLFGITASEAIGQKLKDVIKPVEEYPGQDQERIQKLGAQGYNRTELHYSTPHGEVWVDTTIQVMKEGDKRYGYVITASDITGRKQAEKAIHESEEKFSKAFSSASDAMAIFSSKGGKFLEVNDSYVKLSGYPREELVGRNADELAMWGNPADRERILKLTLEKGRFSNEEIKFRKKSGEISTCLFSAESINLGGERRMIIVLHDITGRKQMETALRESEQKFFKAFNASANGIGITSLKNKCFIEANESISRFTGYTHEEIIGHNALDLKLWANDEELQQCMATLRKDGKVFNMEFSSRTKSGEIRIGLASVELLNIGGEPCRMMVITDITERKKTEEALKDSEEKFSKAFSASANAICITSLPDNKFIEVNESYSRFTGYSREEVIGYTAAELGLWVDKEELEQFRNKIEKEGGFHNLEMQSRTKSGEIRVGLASAETINIGGKPCRIVVITDITDRKKAEEGLRLLSSVTQQVTDSIVVTDPEFKITYMNKAAQDLFGYSIDEVLGTDIGLFDAVPITERVREDIRNALNTGKTWTAVLTKRRKDGSTFLCDCRRSPLFDEAGRLASYTAVYRDITEQKEIEAKLKAHKQLIESILTSMPEGVLVTDSADMVVLANEAFRRIFHTGKKAIENRMLDEAIHVEQLADLFESMKKGNTDNNTLEFRYKVKNQEKIIACVIIKMDGGRMLLTFTDVSREREEEDKLYLMDRLASLGEMAAGLAHELNNPLTGILTLSQLLVNSDIADEHKEDLQCVYSEAKRAANIVKNVLLFTRNNSYENGQSSVNEVVKEVLRLREHEEKTSNINVVTILQDNLPEILLDKYQLQQVFLNIILNAEAAMKEMERPGTLTVTTERVNSHVNIMFSDNGCGIKKDVLPRIFDPFFTTKDIGKGTGLGLSICYGIIVKHGGKISVKTQVGKGTTFTIRMPITES